MKNTFPAGREISRRDFLKLSSTAAAVIIGSQACSKKTAKSIPIAVQLYSIRDVCRENFDLALEQAATMGFEGVEFAGYYNYAENPKDLKKRLDNLGLKPAGTHIRTAALKPDAIDETVAFHKELDCRYLIVPSDRDFTHPEKSKSLADLFNRAAEVLKAEKMFCGFHNHQSEFSLFQGSSYWDLFAERTSREVVLQLDVGWAAVAQQDPAAVIRKHPGRSRTVHFKPAVLPGDDNPEKTAILGRDSIVWDKVITACRQAGGTEWFIIEQEYYPEEKGSLECTRLSLEGLKTILAGME